MKTLAFVVVLLEIANFRLFVRKHKKRASSIRKYRLIKQMNKTELLCEAYIFHHCVVIQPTQESALPSATRSVLNSTTTKIGVIQNNV